MTESPGVPSPQEDLRAEIAAVLGKTSLRDQATLAQLEGWAETFLVPLFAARVAAIEAELAEHQRVYGQMLDNVAERGRQRDLAIEEQAAERKRAERAEAERDHHRQGREDAQIAITKLIREREGWRARAEKAEADLAASHDRHVRDAPVFIQTVHDLIAARAELAAMTAERDKLREINLAWHNERDYIADRWQETKAELAACQERVAFLQAALVSDAEAITFQRDRADKAEERVAAERTQAAAQAWEEGYEACELMTHAIPCNPYREATP